MAGAYSAPSVGADVLPDVIADMQARIKELERPTGTQAADLLSKVLALVTNLIVPQVGSAGVASFTAATSYQNYASFSFTTPASCTQVLISAGGNTTQSTAATGGDVFSARILINGVSSSVTNVASNQGNASTAVFSSAQITGLTPGQVIFVTIQGKLTTGPGTSFPGNNASVSAAALFLP